MRNMTHPTEGLLKHPFDLWGDEYTVSRGQRTALELAMRQGGGDM